MSVIVYVGKLIYYLDEASMSAGVTSLFKKENFESVHNNTLDKPFGT